MKIAYVAPYEGERPHVLAGFPEHEVVFLDAPITDEVPESIRDADVLAVFVDSKLSVEAIQRMHNLKVVALRSTGYDHVPAAYLRERGITVTYVPHYGSQTVAEFAFALMLALSRQAFAAYHLLRTEGAVAVKRFEGFDLKGKTLGVVGTGAIGRHVCQIARGFGMEIVAYDIRPNVAWAAEHGIRYLSFPELLGSADLVTLHVPAAPENIHLLNTDTLALMKPTAYLINTARGDLVDTVALVRALKAGQLAGAGLDVFEGEQFLKDEMALLAPGKTVEEHTWKAFVAEHELLDMPNVIITPHVAFNTVEAKLEITHTTIANVLAALDGSPQNEVPVK